jgi:hypothetical protein
MSMVLLFHEALMKDLSNIQEFARAAHRLPTMPNCPISFTAMHTAVL